MFKSLFGEKNKYEEIKEQRQMHGYIEEIGDDYVPYINVNYYTECDESMKQRCKSITIKVRLGCYTTFWEALERYNNVDKSMACKDYKKIIEKHDEILSIFGGFEDKGHPNRFFKLSDITYYAGNSSCTFDKTKTLDKIAEYENTQRTP